MAEKENKMQEKSTEPYKFVILPDGTRVPVDATEADGLGEVAEPQADTGTEEGAPTVPKKRTYNRKSNKKETK